MRILHTMLRVSDLDQSIAFYTQILNMHLLRRQDYPAGRFTLAFIGYADEAENTVLELTYNWDQQEYDVGDGFGHIAIEVDDIYRVTEKMYEQGVKFLRDPGPMNAGTTIIAFIADPDGYPIELIGKHA